MKEAGTVRIGLAVKSGGETLSALLTRLYGTAGIPIWIQLLTESKKSGTIETSVFEKRAEPCEVMCFDILLVDEDIAAVERFAPGSVRAGVTVVNTDEKGCRVPAHGGRVVSFGLNGKSCVTASSVDDETMMICLQRAFPAVNGAMVERMEFALRRAAGGPAPRPLIAAVSVALCGGLRPEEIAAFFAAEDKNVHAGHIL